MSDMTRKEAIKWLKDMRFEDDETCLENKALDIAISSLETDEAYQLEYESTTKPTIEEFIEYAQKEFGVTVKAVKSDNPDTFEKLFGTTKNDLGVDCISRKALLNATVKKNSIWNHITNSYGDNLEAIVSKLPSVKPQEPKTGHWISDVIQGEIDGQIVKVFTCSKCGAISVFRMTDGKIVNGDLCPNCGCRMVEPQESEE